MILIHSFAFIHARQPPEEAQQYMDAAVQWGGGGADDTPTQRLLALC
jgi:hypothetical protein